MTDIENRIKVFLEQQGKFCNHPLQTELPNSETYELSTLAKTDLIKAIKTLQNVDIKAVNKMLDYVPQLEELRKQINKTFKSGNRVYLCGCGASGRLAVLLEYLWRQSFPDDKKENVIGLLAAGDSAMIKSLEGFEDHGSLGVKQLIKAGFQDGDLLISASASGESPFLLSATEYASKTSTKPWFLHCNTNKALKGRMKNHVIYNQNVISLSLYVGQMALTGSTRMQATTALMLGIGLPLFCNGSIEKELGFFVSFIKNTDISPLKDIIVNEAHAYENHEYVLYDTDSRYGITVLTDTTERAPTFNLVPFENQLDEDKKPSWCYLLFSEAEDVEEAWKMLLGRPVRTLNWNFETSFKRLLGFDFSRSIIELRNSYAAPSHILSIKKIENAIEIAFQGKIASFNVSELTPLFEQLFLKLLLNTASTLVLGRLGFFEGNLMTSLYPSNSKLIDRAIRYIDFMVNVKSGRKLQYDVIANYMFEELKKIKPNESIVNKTVAKIVKTCCK
jgi:N-acetylmuramic acid 6-phosphate etherase